MYEPETLHELRRRLDEQGFRLAAKAERGNHLTLDYLYPGLNEAEGVVLTVRVVLEDLGTR